MSAMMPQVLNIKQIVAGDLPEVFLDLGEWAKYDFPRSPTNIVIQPEGTTVGLLAEVLIGTNIQSIAVTRALADLLWGPDANGPLTPVEVFILPG